mmetsp:Transcript_6822/g.15093  ORF Transcript_6822/g.15093 Transcript_6822/m.15093 type:complete len:428 (-) Transcript_6822:260-1543(-)|eukprot:CAMPEP_0202894484 /NCGR_PEP_ID=MMETSP1392-20130828/3890_1 /ASSEMBLY_ACC=CAM_ASM_000868 /TAXON_ID=225041 /ORGANISM="Chlamydomonas chlamydogama, Strain SAG 11-48b" /LENGTH=427 /DNA_ID=CAMNT_0049579207 /DNA_START=122 /DNA_END=1405 /DNA_ORIENTATION=-
MSFCSGLLVGLAPLGLLAAFLTFGTWPWPDEVFYGNDVVPRVPGQTQFTAPMETETYTRTNMHFISQGDRIEAYQYIPKIQTSQHKCILMAHGLGGQRDFGLHTYADAFAAKGFAVVLFDYRGFGGSDGEPRNWVSPSRHLEDWEAAVEALLPGGPSSSSGLSCSALSLWGTSFSGGHVIVTAAKYRAAISAVVSQVPHLSGVEASKLGMSRRGLLGGLRLLAAGLHDRLRGLVGRSPAYVRLVGRPGDLAFMLLHEEELGSYYAKHPAVRIGGWKPYAPARLALDISRYSPLKSLPMVTAPLMFVSATEDSLCPHHVVRQAAKEYCNSTCELLEYAVNHFDIYKPQVLREVLDQQVGFFKLHMKGAGEGQQRSSSTGAQGAAAPEPAAAAAEEAAAGEEAEEAVEAAAGEEGAAGSGGAEGVREEL